MKKLTRKSLVVAGILSLMSGLSTFSFASNQIVCSGTETVASESGIGPDVNQDFQIVVDLAKGTIVKSVKNSESDSAAGFETIENWALDENANISTLEKIEIQGYTSGATTGKAGHIRITGQRTLGEFDAEIAIVPMSMHVMPQLVERSNAICK